jgi:hypothetical protein
MKDEICMTVGWAMEWSRERRIKNELQDKFKTVSGNIRVPGDNNWSGSRQAVRESTD